MKTIKLIKKYKGCGLMAYKYPSGVWTIGYGHTTGVKSGMQITKGLGIKLFKTESKCF